MCDTCQVHTASDEQDYQNVSQFDNFDKMKLTLLTLVEQNNFYF